jgi:hypothetical protein
MMLGQTKESGVWFSSVWDWRFMFSDHDALYIAFGPLRLRVMKVR